MTIDVGTYGFNFIGEYYKSTRKEDSSFSSQILIKVVIPSVSVTALLSVTCYVSYSAYKRIFTTDTDEEEFVDMRFLYGFAVANLVIDVVCGWMFFLRKDDVFSEKNMDGSISMVTLSSEDTSPPPALGYDNDGSKDIDSSVTHEPHNILVNGSIQTVRKVSQSLSAPARSSHPHPPAGHSQTTTPGSGHSPFPVSKSPHPVAGRRRAQSEDDLSEMDEMSTETSNLNMVSAFTHLSGDTFRTVAVFASALVSDVFPSCSRAKIDAWAAIVVSVSILFATAPLIFGIVDTATRLVSQRNTALVYDSITMQSSHSSDLSSSGRSDADVVAGLHLANDTTSSPIFFSTLQSTSKRSLSEGKYDFLGEDNSATV